MSLKTNYIVAAATLVLATLPTLCLPSMAADSVHSPAVCEPYEPGSSAVVNDWQFTPGEQTTVASNFSRAQQNYRSGHCKNKNHHHSST